MTDQTAEEEHHLPIDLNEQIETTEESPLAGHGWDTYSAIMARIPNADPNVSNDWNFDRIIFIKPTLSGLSILEDSQLKVRAMYFHCLTSKSVSLISIKRIVSWPTATNSEVNRPVLALENGTYYLIGENEPLHIKSVTVDWDGPGKYIFNKDFSAR